MSTIESPYPDNFKELKDEVRAAGLLDRVPVRGSIEMILTLLSMAILFYIVINGRHFQLSHFGLLLDLVFS